MGQTSDVVYVEAVASCYSQCATASGAFGGQSGLTLDTDRAIPAADWVAMAVLVEAWNRFGKMMDLTANQRLVRDRQEAASRFSELTDKYFDMPPPRFDSQATGVRPTIFGPPLWRGGYGTGGVIGPR